jgi:hypothetical protein
MMLSNETIVPMPSETGGMNKQGGCYRSGMFENITSDRTMLNFKGLQRFLYAMFDDL